MTANASFSSVENPAEAPAPLQLDLTASGRLPSLPTAFLAGKDLDLLTPLAFLAPGEPLTRTVPAPAGRADLAAGLRVANASYGHPKAAELAEKLADPATRVVVTGQQPGLFGGPLYTLSKMVAAARWAANLEAAGQPAVAVFWVATEDHDWDESSTAHFPSGGGKLTVGLGEDPDPLLPLGMRTLGPGVSSALEALVGLGETNPGYQQWLARLGEIYRPDARFGEAFCRWAVALLGDRTPLLLDAMLPAVKLAERPHLERLVQARQTLDAASAAADERIVARGHRLQVAPQRGASPLFLLRGGARRRIVWGPDFTTYTLRGADEAPRPVGELLDILAENPAVISPGVLARPAIQDAILGTSLFVLGPGEISYLPQTVPAYEVLGLAGPAVALRPQVVVLEGRDRARIDELRLPLPTLLAAPEELARALASGSAAANALAHAERAVEHALTELGGAVLGLDPSLERPFEKTRETALRALTTFGEKITAAAARQDEVRSRRAEKLRELFAPSGVPQERVVCSSHFPGRFGPAFVTALWQQMGLDGSRLSGVVP